MLKAAYGYISFHVQAAAQSVNALRQRPLASLMTVVVIAVSLTLPALFWILTSNFERLLGNWRQGGQVTLYLKPSISTAVQAHVLDNIRKMEEVGEATLKTPEQGLAELQTQEGMDEILRYLPENPLPAVIEVTPALKVNDPAQIKQFYNRLKTIPEVEQAKLDMQWVDRLHTILNFANKATHSLMLLLAVAVILIISNTLRLTVQNRSEEIQILKLIGATDPFITRPFLYAGIWYAVSGAFLAISFVNIFLLSLSPSVRQLASAYQMSYPLQGMTLGQAFVFLMFSVLLGWVGANISVRRQLASIEPYN
ncbi:permease-like cell division protein FtsX [Legionella londiniensis]|uniref:Cell division protein FtsX n=1 Tax=Legionella londiniensis TaxID=45068 RepID=A0A0W0VHZ2_9GAMM|nr:permease-like cell division protein FtsX [Legionella londiniensis]KTD19659.1 cell division ATP transporter FtsX [Legionella londiniensis]STX92431.1 cell division transport system permease protein [Legionella londiniensis]